MDLEWPLPERHRARLVWGWVQRQDLSTMYAAIKARQGGVGRSAIAPQISLALWLYATLQGVGGASRKMLVDGGFPARAQLDAVADKTGLYAPVPEARAKKNGRGNELARDKHGPKAEDSEAVANR